jgi:hypothetical protein
VYSRIRLNGRAGEARSDHRAEKFKKERSEPNPEIGPQVKAKVRVHDNVVGRSQRAMTFSLRKEVIQPQVLLRLPCYDFTPIMNYTLDGCFLAVSPPASSMVHFRDVTGGVYKARERIHRSVLICDY